MSAKSDINKNTIINCIFGLSAGNKILKILFSQSNTVKMIGLKGQHNGFEGGSVKTKRYIAVNIPLYGSTAVATLPTVVLRFVC